MSVGQSGVSLENLCPPRHKPLHQQKKKKCFSSFSMSVGQCGVTLENHCPPRQESVHRQKKKNCFSTFSMSAGQCLIRKPLPTPTQASSSVEEEEFFSFLFGRRNVILLFLCMQDSVVFHQKNSAHPDTSLFISRRRKILFLSLWKKKFYSAFSMNVGQCGVPLENLCPPRHKPLHQQKKKNSFPFSLEEEILFCFFYEFRTVWCSIRKPLPTQTRASLSVMKKNSFSFRRRKIILLFLCMQDSVLFHQKTFAHPDTILFVSRRRILFLSPWKKKYFSISSMFVGQRGSSNRKCLPTHSKASPST